MQLALLIANHSIKSNLKWELLTHTGDYRSTTWMTLGILQYTPVEVQLARITALMVKRVDVPSQIAVLHTLKTKPVRDFRKQGMHL